MAAELPPRVLYASPFIPPEFIAAHGLKPHRFTESASTDCHQGRCGTAAGFDAALAGGDLAILATSCDQMRRSGEDATVPLFRFALSATWDNANALRGYRSELERLSRFLVRHGGSAPDRATLAKHLLDHDTRRARLRAGCAALPGRAAAEAIATWAETGVVPNTDPVPEADGGRVPIALLGGPIPRHEFALYDLIESCGARVALDGSEGGERGLAAPIDRRNATDDPLDELANAYFLGIPDAFRRPDSLLYTWLDRMIPERGLRAVVVRLDPWCDLWRAQVPRLKDWGRLPVLAIESGEPVGNAPRLATRLGALAEMLR